MQTAADSLAQDSVFSVTDSLGQVTDKLASWIDALISHIPEIVSAVVVFLIFLGLAKLARRVVRGGMSRISNNLQVTNLLATIIYVAVVAIGLFIALGILQLDGTVSKLLAGVGIVGLALGFAFQDIAANFISGVLMAIRRPFKEGDLIETNDYLGIIEEVTLRSTLVRTLTGQLVLIPNSKVFQNAIVNYTTLGSRRVDLSVGVSYGDDLEKAKSLALAAVRGIEGRDESREPELFYESFGDSSINYTVRFWIGFRKQVDYLSLRSEAIMRIKTAYDEGGITIPFPIRTLDFGIVGGKELSEALPEGLRGASASKGDA